MRAIFPDTNLLLQCKELRQLPWQEVANGEDHLLIVVTRTVQKEIDRLKSDGSPRRSRRARAISNGLFARVLDAEENVITICETAPRVDVTLCPQQTIAEIAGLDLKKPDDCIIAEVLTYRDAHSEGSTAFISDDTGALLTAKNHQCDYIRIPESWLLEPEPDPRQKQIQSLEERVKVLEHRAPRITFITEPGREAVISVTAYRELSEEQLNNLVVLTEEKHPMRSQFDAPEQEKRFREANGFVYVRPTQEVIRRYQDVEYPEWRNCVEQHFRSLPARLERPTRHLEVVVSLQNDGQAPAESAMVEFWLSSGFSFRPVSEEDDEETRTPSLSIPELPRPPNAPNGSWRRDNFLSSISEAVRPLLLGVDHPRLPTPLFPSDFISPRIDRDKHVFYWVDRPDDYADRWAFECAEFRHRVEAESFTMLIYVTKDNPSGGVLHCRLTARNLPEPKTFRLPLRVVYSQGDTLEKARGQISL